MTNKAYRRGRSCFRMGIPNYIINAKAGYDLTAEPILYSYYLEVDDVN